MNKKRLFAFILDMVIIVIFTLLIYGILCYANIRIVTPMVAIIGWGMLVGKDSFNGMSVGKRFVGIQVIDSRTKQIATPLKCLLRNLFYFVMPIDLFYMFINPYRIRLGDYVAHTEVSLKNGLLPKFSFCEVLVPIIYILIGLIVMEIIYYFRAVEFGLL